jgi:hydroxyacylglutathione hydrolase
MKLTEKVFLVGSGNNGFEMTDSYDCHVYLIDGGDELALIDIGSGMGVSLILQNIEKHGFNLKHLKYLFLTHPHADHAGGTAHLKEIFDIRVVASKGCAELLHAGDEDGINLTLARESGMYPEDYQLNPCKIDIEVSDGDLIKVGDFELKVIETPGHCETHLSYYTKIGDRNVLFAGDTIFNKGKILLINTHDCNLQAYSNTALKLAKLDVDVLLPGHELLVLKDGNKHIVKAASIFENMGVPQNIL